MKLVAESVILEWEWGSAEVVKMSQSVEMRPAYEWTCEACGRDQFEPAMEVHKNVQLAYPDEVTCNNCGATFSTHHWQDESDELRDDWGLDAPVEGYDD